MKKIFISLKDLHRIERVFISIWVHPLQSKHRKGIRCLIRKVWKAHVNLYNTRAVEEHKREGFNNFSLYRYTFHNTEKKSLHDEIKGECL